VAWCGGGALPGRDAEAAASQSVIEVKKDKKPRFFLQPSGEKGRCRTTRKAKPSEKRFF
jgi:hypothetical protein